MKLIASETRTVDAPSAARWGVSSVAVALLQVIRPGQWIKNLTCFAGLIFSGRLFWPEMQLRAGAAFLGFSAAASAVYLLNDYLDRVRDRTNPRTAQRPLASGRLPLWLAGGAFLLLLATSLSIAVWLGVASLVVVAAYLALNFAYSIRLKNTVIADVICIAIGFVLRVLLGVYSVRVDPSPWIVLCMFFLALFLGFGKRRGELVDLQEASAFARPVLLKYTILYIDLALGVTATLTLTAYSLYCVGPSHDPSMIVTILPVVYCVLRYAHQVIVEGRGQSPERLLYADKILWIGILSWVALSVAVIYGKLGLSWFVEGAK